MKKIFIYSSLIAAALNFAACTEDFTDWAAPQTNAQEEQQLAVKGTIEAASASIDLNQVPAEGVAIVNFLKADNASEKASVKFTKLILNNEIEVPFMTQGNALVASADDLSAAIKACYNSLACTDRKCTFKVEADLVDASGTAILMPVETNEVEVSVKTLALPSIAGENAYYYIGGYNGWNLASPTPMDANGDGTYSCVIEIGDSEWFAFAPQSAVDSQDWNSLFRAQTNGDEATSGFFGESASGYSFCCQTGGKYKFTINPKNWTYSYAPYAESIYYAGDANGWSFSPLAKAGNDFVGYYYVKYADNSNTWGFKFTQDASWDKPQYGAGADGNSIALDGGNIQLAEKDAFYQIVVNTDNLTCTLNEISAMSLIGSAVNGDSSWGTDYDLTFNTETMAWEGTYEMTDGEYKVRANHDWSLSWGGALDALTSQNGANLSISAGTYKFTFKPNCDGQGTLTVVAQ
ncbi:MAG: DUF5115 domain-containing protein [Bacteroidaceae bacterium]|nr:DUF5115 domain-containing protein [Bacteroidaceae bacterium]